MMFYKVAEKYKSWRVSYQGGLLLIYQARAKCADVWCKPLGDDPTYHATLVQLPDQTHCRTTVQSIKKETLFHLERRANERH